LNPPVTDAESFKLFVLTVSDVGFAVVGTEGLALPSVTGSAKQPEFAGLLLPSPLYTASQYHVPVLSGLNPPGLLPATSVVEYGPTPFTDSASVYRNVPAAGPAGGATHVSVGSNRYQVIVPVGLNPPVTDAESFKLFVLTVSDVGFAVVGTAGLAFLTVTGSAKHPEFAGLLLPSPLYTASQYHVPVMSGLNPPGLLPARSVVEYGPAPSTEIASVYRNVPAAGPFGGPTHDSVGSNRYHVSVPVALNPPLIDAESFKLFVFTVSDVGFAVVGTEGLVLLTVTGSAKQPESAGELLVSPL
jgi:hypothetical protein